MRTLRALAVLAVVVAGSLVLAPSPARAGGWAVTVLDPLPERLEPGTPYTVGMWVLQHGSHPFEGELGPVSLTLTGDQGEVTYPAVALIEPAHYAAAIVAPRAGTYKVVATQGLFAPYDVGTLTVPGGFLAGDIPPPLPYKDAEKNWPGLVRPPIMPVDPNRDPFSSDVAPAVKAPAADPVAAQERVAAVTPAEPASRTPLVAVAAVVVAGLAFLLTKRQRRWRAAQRSGPSPSSSSMTWIAASSADAPPPSTPASQATESASSSSPNPSSSSTIRPARGSVS
jgi:hypothetical protein